MKDWFRRLTPGRQVTGVSAGLATAGMIMLAIAVPVHKARHNMQLRLETVSGELLLVQELAADYRTLATASARNPAVGGLSASINSSLEDLPLQPSRIQQNGEGALQVSFDNVRFNSLLPWLYQIENLQSVALEQATLTRGVNGTSNVSVVLGSR